jgi:outer membrane protein assembly factor BamE
MQTLVTRLGAAVAVTTLAACSSLGNPASIITPYKVEVVQGNFVSKEQFEAVQAGMPRAQVRDILGSPLVTSAFHADRWDYVFTIRRQGAEPQQRKLTVFFKGDEVERVEGGELPTEEAFVAALSTSRSLGKVPLLEVPPEVLKDLSLKAEEQKQASARTDPAQSATNSVATTYPPLEAPGTTASAWDASTQRIASNSPVSRAAATPDAALPAPVLTTPAPTAPVATSPVPVPPAPVITTPAPAPVAPAPAPAAPAAATAPAPAAVAPSSPNAIDPEINQLLTRWQNDWQSRNAAAYFTHYVPEFKGTSATRAEWEALRRPRIEAAQRVSLAVLDVRARMVTPTEARVVFRQVYESSSGNENGTKAMFLVKRDGRWMIEREFFTPAP